MTKILYLILVSGICFILIKEYYIIMRNYIIEFAFNKILEIYIYSIYNNRVCNNNYDYKTTCTTCYYQSEITAKQLLNTKKILENDFIPKDEVYIIYPELLSKDLWTRRVL